MDARTLPPVFRTALALFNALRCLGFESEQIYFCYNPKQGFLIEVKHDGKEWGIRAGALDMTYEKWQVEWKKVADAMANGEMDQESIDEVWRDFYPHRMRVVEDLLRGGIRIPGRY